MTAILKMCDNVNLEMGVVDLEHTIENKVVSTSCHMYRGREVLSRVANVDIRGWYRTNLSGATDSTSGIMAEG